MDKTKTGGGFTRRAAFGFGASALAAPRIALADPVVDRTARIVVGFAATGGGVDLVARLLAERLRGVYAPQVIVENKPGAGARLAVDYVKGVPPDGTTMLLSPESIFTIQPHVYPRTVRYDALTDFIPVSSISSFPFGLAVAANHPARDLAGFAAWAKSQGQAVPYATPAAGSTPHFAAVQMSKALGVDMMHVPYRDTALLPSDLMTGRLSALMNVMGSLIEYHLAGRMRLLAITAPQRVPQIPDVPTFAELGYPALTIDEQFSLMVPAGTLAALVSGLSEAVATVIVQPAMRAALERVYQTPLGSSPAALAERLRTERDHWGPIVRESGYRPEE